MVARKQKKSLTPPVKIEEDPGCRALREVLGEHLSPASADKVFRRIKKRLMPFRRQFEAELRAQREGRESHAS